MYYCETIDECSKQIVSKVINLDISYLANMRLFECFTRMIKTIFIWISIFILLYNRIFDYNTKTFFITRGASILVYAISAILVSWVKFNFNESYKEAKINLVRNLIEGCKEFNELECDEWQKKEIMKKMAELGSVSVTWNDDKKE